MSKRCLREIYLLRTIGHPNIISLRDAFLLGSNPDLYFVMKFMPMDLRKRLVEQTPLPPNETKRFAYQLFSALAVTTLGCIFVAISHIQLCSICIREV